AIADKIGKPEDIPAVRMAKELEAKLQERFAHWDTQLPGMTDSTELQAASDEVKAISQRKYKLPQDLAQLRKDLDTLKRTDKLVQARQAVLKEARQNLQADVRTLRDGYAQVISLRDANLKDLLIDPQNNVFSAENILSALLGRSLVDTTQKYLGYYEKFKGYLPEQKKTPEVKVVAQKRANGTTVDFIRAGALPTVY
ncbi:hypothetical protein ACQV5M_20430, partial [Leptospira sp. SA-E8]|uniref:hypothetical protein n=1 Tax=Leptospira sp. SA-E8 TaxID=3422259 RepID=UPI003EB9FD11